MIYQQTFLVDLKSGDSLLQTPETLKAALLLSYIPTHYQSINTK
jgi:hypothetical protein